MTNPDHTEVIRQFAAAGKAQDDALRAAVRPTPPNPAAAAYTYAPGQHVLDLMTGQIGVVTSVERRNVILPGT